MNLSLEDIKLELPAKLQDICEFSFNFDNLIKIVDYLFNNNLIMIKELKDLRTKVFNLELIHSEIDKIKEKAAMIEKSNDNINKNFMDIRDKFINNDSKVMELFRKHEEFGIRLDKSEEIVKGHEININNLNKVVEENVKTLNEVQENFGINLNKMQKFEIEMNDIHKENMHTHEFLENYNNRIIEEHNFSNTHIETINGNIFVINETINTIKNNIEKKNRDFDNCINNIMDTISNFSSKGITGEQADKNLFKLSMNEIEREKEKFNTFIEEQKYSKEKRDKEIDTIKKIIDSMKINIDKINNKLFSQNNEDENEDSKGKSEENLSKLNESIKKITKSIVTLPNREEFESSNRNIILRLKKLEEEHSILIKAQKNFNNNNDKNESSINLSHLNTLAEKIRISISTELTDNLKDMLKKEGKNLDISNNPQILEMIKIITQHSEEIINNNKSVIDLRKTIFAIEADKKFNNLNSKVTKLEEDSDRNKKKIFEIIKSIEGFEDFDENNSEVSNYSPNTIKGKLELLEKSFNNVNDKILQLEAKNKSLSKELKEDIKSNLRIETLKTVGQFRERLEIFTRRFEEELKNKIDQMGLNNFEKRMNTKIYYDLKDKLNRNEMQKNNNVINRKIDSLENKISKTLVDTIIDLQMDEAPLIVKKTSNNMDICASCNQYIQKEKVYNNFTEQNSQNSLSVKNLNHSGTNKFRKTFYGFNHTPTSMPKINNVISLRKELPDIHKYG